MFEIKDLSTYFYQESSVVKAVDHVGFNVQKGEILGILGESGSGKSTIAHSILRLIPSPGRIVSGEILFNGQDLLRLPEREMIKVRGAKISMIFQDPFTSLNPVYTIGDQIAEAIRLHQRMGKKDAWRKAVEMLDLVRVQEPVARAHDYPHQFSGGMRQRAMIAMALACRPELLIADEPTTALDVTIQAEILSLIKDVRNRFGLSIIYITHNFGIIKALCQNVIVMEKGKVVEKGAVNDVLLSPQHGYTKKLIGCLEVLKG